MAIQDFTAGQVLTAAQMDSLQANDYNWTVSTKTASYVLVAADKGTRVVMNSASATTITVNTSLFNAGDTLFIQNIGAGTCTITAGTATVTTASSLALAQWGGGTLYFTSASAAIFFSGGGTSYGTATGGSSSSITVGGINYTLLTFTTDGTLTVTKAGLFDVLLVGGGGGGGGAWSSQASGGGGAGAVIGLAATTTIYLTSNQSIDVGAGGALGQALARGNVGFESAIGSIIAAAGGGSGGAANQTPSEVAASGGGSGGGAGSANGTRLKGESVNEAFGNDGGTGVTNTAGGGGGGYSSAGGDGVTTTGGAGGNGVDISSWISGATKYVAAGGVGCGTVTNGAAGTGGAAAGATPTNAGCGGSGAAGLNDGVAGSAGVVYVRFKV